MWVYAIDIHTEMVKLQGKSVPSTTMVSKRAEYFTSGYIKLEIDAREASPKTASTLDLAASHYNFNLWLQKFLKNYPIFKRRNTFPSR